MKFFYSYIHTNFKFSTSTIQHKVEIPPSSPRCKVCSFTLSNFFIKILVIQYNLLQELSSARKNISLELGGTPNLYYRYLPPTDVLL